MTGSPRHTPSGAVMVVGLGSPDRGDDAVGPAVARAVAAVAPPGIRVVEREDPTALMDLWADADTAVVVDAVVSGRPAGTIHVLETGAEDDALPAGAWRDTGRASTHAFGLAASVELARALRRLPPRLVLVGIEATGFEHGSALSEPVDRAVEPAVTTVLALLADASPPLVAGRGERRVPR